MITYAHLILLLNLWCKENATDYNQCFKKAEVCAKVVRDYEKCIERVKEAQRGDI